MPLKDQRRRAEEKDPFDIVRYWNNRRTEKGWWHSFELPDGTRIDGVCDLAGLKNRIAQFPIPDDLRGKRVLDIGTWDGWFAFEMEHRGAEVVAVDNWDNPLFREMHARLASRIDYRQADMYDLTPERLGRFDIVLFMGVLYHLKHPLLALERVCALTTEMAAVDSFILREEHRKGHDVSSRPIMEFYETNEFGGQTDNWIGPSLPCLLAFCRTAGFARVELRSQIQHSACVACYRKWEPASFTREGPELINAAHNLNHGINFDSTRDEYVSVWFESSANSANEIALDTVKPQVGGYGVRPIHLGPAEGNVWQANFKLPPGLPPGWHDVTVRIADSLESNAKRIAVDVPLRTEGIRLTGVRDGQTWTENRLDLQRGNALSIWVAGLPKNADRHNLHVYLDGRRLKVAYIEERADDDARQVNVEVPLEVPRGVALIGVEAGGQRTDAANVTVTK
jgi:tRNA (mo5U34)-methyltransferase